jgi:hypothetical protein
MTYKLTRIASFIAILTVLIAAFVLAQEMGAGRPSGTPYDVAVAPGAGSFAAAIGGADPFPASRLAANSPPLLLPVVNYGSGGQQARSVALADLNADGNPDVVVVNANSGTVGVLLGNGYGWFEPVVTYRTGPAGPRSVAVGDVNSDGKPDIVVATASCGIGVLLGNGDGTFQPPVTYGSTVCSASSVVLGDVNGDGKLDLLVAEYRKIAVLLGNGDGTFQPAVIYGWGGGDGSSWGPNSLAVADLNHDGKLDVLVASGNFPWPFGHGTVGVLLGNGDGTFKTAINYDSGDLYAFSLAVGDVNGDGKADLVVANVNSNDVGVLLGNGDGTFQPAVTYGSGGHLPFAVAVADVNGDGRPDLLVSNVCTVNCTGHNTLDVLLGNGNGSFQPAVAYGSGGLGSEGLAVSDVNRDGHLDVVVTNLYGVGVLLGKTLVATKTAVTTSASPSVVGQPVTFTATVTSGQGQVPDGRLAEFYDGMTMLGSAKLASGTAAYTTWSLSAKGHTIRAIYSGDPIFPTSSGAVHQTVTPLPTTINLASRPNPSIYGQEVTFTATVTPSEPYQPTGKVRFMDGTTVIGAPTLSNGVATLTKSKLAIGTHSITAQYLGDAVSGKSTSTVLNQVVE